MINYLCSAICIGCRKLPDEIPEYQEGVHWEVGEFRNSEHFVKKEEGTYNKDNGHFLCTDCYIKAGCPSSPQGWRAP